MQDSVTPNVTLGTAITFATVYEVCGFTHPWNYQYPCSTGSSSSRAIFNGIGTLKRSFKITCTATAAEGPGFSRSRQRRCGCRAVIPPLIERTPNASWGTENNPQFVSLEGRTDLSEE